MENVVSARRLRKSMLYDLPDFNNSVESDENKRLGIIDKFLIKSLISCILLFTIIYIVGKYGNILKENRYIMRVYEHYKFNFSNELILNNLENEIIHINNVTGDIVPDNIKKDILNIYFTVIKPFVLNEKNINTEEVVIYSDNIEGNFDNDIQIKEVSSKIEISLEEMDLITPVKGIITSRFGSREKIFEELSNNHTGIDIANEIGTDIISASNGIVVKVVSLDKYYGNYIDIEDNGYTFRYAHLNEILVKENDEIKKGNIIAKMGSTGMSTGPHLHFEIIKDNIRINPESVIKF